MIPPFLLTMRWPWAAAVRLAAAALVATIIS
jgi:hypothetical protein